MVIYRKLENIETVKGAILTIGSFDGLHRGHQEIIKKVVHTSRALSENSVVVTFDPHPKQVLLNPSEKFELLMTIDRKLRFLNDLGVDISLVIPFSLKFSETTAEEFLRDIVIKYFKPSKVIVGYDHHFGHQRKGDSNLLKKYGPKEGFDVEVISEVGDQKETFSSSRIRKLIREGHVRRAAFELGWVYGFDAVVVHGSRRGHELGFPTANFIPANDAQLIPGVGVYFARGNFGNSCYYGMCNVGYRPTFEENKLVMEVHFFHEFKDDLYGSTFEIQFLERIRNEKKFHSPQELKDQLTKDREACLSRLTIYQQEEIWR